MHILGEDFGEPGEEGLIEYKGALQAVACGAQWPRQRVSDLIMQSRQQEHDTTCIRCGRAPETLRHRAWECEANIAIPGFKLSDDLVHKARAQLYAGDYEAYWPRGMLPKRGGAPSRTLRTSL